MAAILPCVRDANPTQRNKRANWSQFDVSRPLPQPSPIAYIPGLSTLAENS